jgi:hypothetical protein
VSSETFHERQRRAVADELQSPASVTRSATLTFETLAEQRRDTQRGTAPPLTSQ